MTGQLIDKDDALPERELLARLATLPHKAEVPPDVWETVASRIGKEEPHPMPAPRPRRPRFAMQAAAALVLFAGSEYVAALASLRRQDDPACRSQGREAALATLQGAAYELEKLGADDLGVRQALERVGPARNLVRF
jgi:hypothetical protein